jgi:ABC-2 type transport system permease protein
MTGIAAPPTTQPARTERRAGALTGTGTQLRFLLRRDRIKLPVWAGGLGLFVLYLLAALPTVAETEEELAGTVELFGDPVGRMLTGPGYGFDDPTFERFIANGYGLYFLILAALMSILLVSRHTRAEEQSGRAELVRANVVGRHANLSATLLLALLTNVAAGLIVWLMMVAPGGYPAHGSLVFATGITVTGLAFAGLTAVTVQLSEYARAASAMSGAVLGAAFVVRAAGDMAGEGGTALSWFSPLAWAQQTAPFVLDRWWPLILPLAFAVVVAALGFRLSTRRDLGASLVAVRPGASRAAPWIGTPFGLALRLQRASIIGWTAALAITGLVFGGYSDALLSAMDDMPDAFVDLFGEQDLIAGYLGFMAQFMAVLIGVFVILAVQGWRSEETTGRAEPVLATPVSRTMWLMANLAVTAAGVLVVSVAAGLASGLAAAGVTGDAQHIADLVLAQLNHLPAVLVVLGVATLLFGLLPRAIAAAWAIVGYGVFVGTFGPLMDLPQAAMNLSPFEHAAELPLEPFEVGPVFALLLFALVGAAVGLLGIRRRGINVA